jgi:hypothetical protein
MSQWRTSFAGNIDVGQLRFDGLTTTGVYNEFAAIYATAGTNTATGAPTALVFRTQNASFVAAERMRITPAGDVGIGNTPSGTYKLEVTGAFFASSAVLGAALPVGSGGTGATTLTGVVIGTGTTAFTTKTNPSGAFVGDTDTQNLTNKTLTTGNTLNAGTTISDTGTIATTSPGFRGIPQISITANRTLGLTDAGKTIYLTGSTSGQAVTIPSSATDFPIGTVIRIVNDSTQSWTIPITTDTLLWSPSGTTTGTRALASRGAATIEKMTSTRWWITGVGLT